MTEEEEFKGKVVLAIGQNNRSIISPTDADFSDLEEYEFNDSDHDEVKDLECGIYELEIEYFAWEESYPESNLTEGDSELKILKVKKLSYN